MSRYGHRDTRKKLLKMLDTIELESLSEKLKKWELRLDRIRIEMRETIEAFQAVLNAKGRDRITSPSQRQALQDAIEELQGALDGITWSVAELPYVEAPGGVLGHRFWLGQIYSMALTEPERYQHEPTSEIGNEDAEVSQ